MNPEAEKLFKDSPVAWSKWEMQHNGSYWEDRLRNGNGLIQTIARFVIKNGQPAHDRGES